MRRTRVLLTFGLAALIAVGGGIAIAAVPGADGVLTGCFDKRTGALRIIDVAKQTCRQAETRLTWNQRVPAVPPGRRGCPARRDRRARRGRPAQASPRSTT